MLGISVATVLALMAGGAVADEATGKIEKIDLTKNTFSVGDKNFQWSRENSLGAKLDELKDGDTVKVMYDMNQDGHNTVTQVTKE